jgi:hypothetical protein
MNSCHTQYNLSSSLIFDIFHVWIRYGNNPRVSVKCEIVSQINEISRTQYQYLFICKVKNLCIINLRIFVDLELFNVGIQLLLYLKILKEVYVLLGSDWQSKKVNESCIFDFFILSAIHFQWKCTLK